MLKASGAVGDPLSMADPPQAPTLLGSQGGGGGRLQRVWPGLLAAAIAVGVFAVTIGHGFALDDRELLQSPLLERPWDLRALFAGGYYARADRYLEIYRPLGQGALLWNAAAAKALAGSYSAPALYHAANILLHAIASFLLFVWLAGLPISRRIAGSAAVLWAVLPVHVEVAANVASRSESLALAFGLGFLLAFRRGRALLAAALLLAALWSKESAVAFLPLAFVEAALFPRSGERFPKRTWIPSAAVLALWFVLRGAALAGEESSTIYVENPVASASLGVRWMTAGAVQLHYLRDQLVPLWLSADHSFREIAPLRTPFDPRVLGFLALLAVAGVSAWRLRRIRPEIAFCVLGYAILFSVTSNFLFPIGSIMADRFAYAPSIFVCLLLAVALGELRLAGLAIAGVILLATAFAGRSFLWTAVWKDDLALGQSMVRTAPEGAKAHEHLATALRERGRMAEAVVEYGKSIEIYPFRPEPYAGLGMAEEFLKEDPDVLIQTWSNSIRFATRGERPLIQQALAAVDLGDWPELLRIRGEIVAADPEDRFLLRIDRILHAAFDLSEMTHSGEDWARANVLFRLRDWAAAEAKYVRSLHHGDLPGNEVPNVLLNLAVCHEHLGHPARAEHYRELAAAWIQKHR